ncbi:hypothetical protein RHOER0001_4489 [Rhodococcus erythropolis SK121]|nr:hypothetical protein RHOER0001_4489 [Rhodococcus erythropolis SK121]
MIHVREVPASFRGWDFFDGGAVCVVTLTGGAFGLVVYIA